MISTSTTTINHTDYKTTLGHIKEETGLIFTTQNILGFDKVDKMKDDGHHFIDLISDKPKVFVPVYLSFYHFYHDAFGEFLWQYEQMPDAKYIIDITSIADINPLPSYIKMFFNFLNDKKVDYQPIDFRKINKMNINDFYFKNHESESPEINNPSPKLYEMSQNYVKDKNVPATKKIFLSRKNFQSRDLSKLTKGRLPYENDNRLDDEPKLQEYLKTLGFEIVIPEEFKTFQDQINCMYQAKMIMSTTSSGFTNACFMRPGSTMVELITPLISFNRVGNGVTSPISSGQEEIHHYYHLMSQAMDHTYIGINNKTRSTDKIIETIENNKLLKAWLSE